MIIKNYIVNIFRKIFWVHRQILMELNPKNSNFAVCSDVSWRYANSRDILDMLDSGEMGINRENYKYFNAISIDNNKMLIGELSSEVVAYVCVVFVRKIFLRRYFKMYPNEGFVLACYTRPDFRGRGIGVQALVELRNRLIRVNPSLHLFCHIDCSNKSSRRMFEKAGYVLAKTSIYRIHFLKWNFVFQKGKYEHRFIIDPKICQPEKYL